MRTLLVATLALAPVLVHAQAQSPAQPRGAQTPVLESKLVSPEPVAAAATLNAAHAVSVLVEPKLIKWSNVEVDNHAWRVAASSNGDHTVTVSMNVTADGIPTNLQVVDSADPLLNRSVLDAVSNYRFAPALLDSKPTAVEVVLKVNVRE